MGTERRTRGVLASLNPRGDRRQIVRRARREKGDPTEDLLTLVKRLFFETEQRQRRSEVQSARDRPAEVGQPVALPVGEAEHPLEHPLEANRLRGERDEVKAVLGEPHIWHAPAIDLKLLAVLVLDLDASDVGRGRLFLVRKLHAVTLCPSEHALLLAHRQGLE